MQSVHRRALLALLSTIPLTSLGAIISLWSATGIVGQIVLVIFQIWLLIFPVAWLLWVEKKPLKIPTPHGRDWIIGTILGLLMFSIILAIYWLIAQYWLDVGYVREKVKKIGFFNPLLFQLGGVYFTLINSLIEEYFWRWFIYRRCEELVAEKTAVSLSAFLFTLHHIIVLATYTDWQMVVLGSLAVFAAGVIWSEYYRRYRSIWGCYFSHAIAVLALYITAWQILY